MAITAADALVSEWFLTRYGSGEVMRKIYDPGTGHEAQIAELDVVRCVKTRIGAQVAVREGTKRPFDRVQAGGVQRSG